MKQHALLGLLGQASGPILQETAGRITALNAATGKKGLVLRPDQALELAKARAQALRDNDRIEIGIGALEKIIRTFAGSLYAQPDSWEEILHTVTGHFYFIKSETHDAVSDNELIDLLFYAFDGICAGSVGQLDEYAEALMASFSGFPEKFEIEADTEISDTQKLEAVLGRIPAADPAFYPDFAASFFHLRTRMAGRLNDFAILFAMQREYEDCGGDFAEFERRCERLPEQIRGGNVR